MLGGNVLLNRVYDLVNFQKIKLLCKKLIYKYLKLANEKNKTKNDIKDNVNNNKVKLKLLNL